MLVVMLEEGSCFLLAASAICISTIWKAQLERCAERRPSVTKQRARDLQIVQQWPESRNRSLKSKPLARRVSTAEFRRRARVAAPRSLRGTPSVELIIVRTFSNPFGPTAIRLNVLPNRSSDLGSAENVVRKKGTSRRDRVSRDRPAATGPDHVATGGRLARRHLATGRRPRHGHQRRRPRPTCCY